DPLETAKRELEEETGLKAEEWTYLQEVHLSNSVSDEHGHIYLARGLSQGAASPEETEQLQVRKIPIKEACQMVAEGKITDSITIIGLLRVQLLLEKGELL
ncbi:MAG: NUDIX hydrolase, partial [Mucilaginibacter polytrichastri]|nr:NUDIX hydrolase [Mucilaginibacter polytrichastri]